MIERMDAAEAARWYVRVPAEAVAVQQHSPWQRRKRGSTQTCVARNHAMCASVSSGGNSTLAGI